MRHAGRICSLKFSSTRSDVGNTRAVLQHRFLVTFTASKPFCHLVLICNRDGFSRFPDICIRSLLESVDPSVAALRFDPDEKESSIKV